MVAEPWRSVIRHSLLRANGAIEYCIDSIGEPGPAVRAVYSQGGKVEMFKAAWPHQWILVAHPPVR